MTYMYMYMYNVTVTLFPHYNRHMYIVHVFLLYYFREEIVLKLKEELTVLKAECDRLEENVINIINTINMLLFLLYMYIQNKLQSISHEEAILKLQEKMQIHINDKQRYTCTCTCFIHVQVPVQCTCTCTL